MSKYYVVIKRHALRLLISLTILLFFILHVTKFIEWDFINALENKAYDVRVRLTMPNIVDSRIVIVDIDEQSLNEIGRWPWNRKVIANLIEQLFNTYHIDVLGMDVVFAEPDNSSGLKQLRELAQGPLKEAKRFSEILKTLETELDYDALLAKSMRNRRIVLGYAFPIGQDGAQVEAGKLPPPVFSREEVQTYQLNYITANGFAGNLPEFQANAMTAGHFVFTPDPDGIVRRVPMLYGYKGQLYESLSLAVARAVFGNPKIKLGVVTSESSYHNLEFLKMGNRNIPVAGNIQTLIPFQGSQGSFPYVSASDVLNKQVKNPEILKDKIVLLGTSAAGLWDLRATPVEEIYPGVEIHASLISGLLDNRIMENPNYMIGMEVSLLILIGLVMIIVLPLLSPLLATVGTIIVFGFVFGLNINIWTQMQLVLPLATTFLLMLTLFLFNMSYGYFIETSNKRNLTGLFGQYVPPELVDEMSNNLGREFSMEGESREMTVLFSDIRDFTSISENLALAPKELSQLMNEYLTPMTHAIHHHRGTIDKYIGDAIMAFWNAPLNDPHHARHAIDTAMEMLERLKEIQLKFHAKGWPEINIGIGLNTGIMNVGNMGSQFRIAYTVLGDAVNLASRLEGTTKQYGVQIIVSEMTKAAVPEYLYRKLDFVRVKGKVQPVAIFEPVGLHGQIALNVMAEIAHYEQALEHYQQQHWPLARKKFARLCEEYPERFLYSLYLKRIENFIKNPPGDNWDGIYTFTTK
ncbi:MAG: adenylate/guanylate cyclase domain-containing protein [Thiomargarita sp.]|nr:adenylate/guanylate cyclase domain-containing protein [Thiomargarita sp.]